MLRIFDLKKGHYGYLNRKKRLLMVEILILLAGIVILLVLGITQTGLKVRDPSVDYALPILYAETLRKGTRKNLLTIVAIVSVLPMAKQLVILIAVWKYHSRPKEEYDQAAAIVKDGILDTELVITSKTDQAFCLDYVCIHERGVFCYCADEKTDRKKAETYLQGFLKNNDLPADVFFIKGWKNYLSRLSSLPSEDRKTCSEDLLRIEGVLRALAI